MDRPGSTSSTRRPGSTARRSVAALPFGCHRCCRKSRRRRPAISMRPRLSASLSTFIVGNRRSCMETPPPAPGDAPRDLGGDLGGDLAGALAAIRSVAEKLRGEVQKAIVGQEDALDLLLVALFSDGHILLEGAPGTAKTLLVRAFAAAMNLKFGRIQFTPDLMPGDVIGTNLFNFQSNTFQLVKGPIFTQVLLADEINRTPPKTQAALLQAMQEREVTIDNTTYDLGAGFMVIATQNPIEQQGTYPLPEAQLDRFLFKHVVPYPSREDELAIVTRHGSHGAMRKLETLGITPVF